jgi:hypothetical protein
MVFADSKAHFLAQTFVDDGAMEFRRPRLRTRSCRPGSSAMRQEVLEIRVSEPNFARFSDHLDT